MSQDQKKSEEKEITVNTNELSEAWEKGDRAEELFYELKENILEFPKWITNTSLALLGFYLALLIQLKLSDYDVKNFKALAPLVSLTLAVLIGFFIKFRYRFGKAIMKIFELANEFVDLARLIDEKFVQKGAKTDVTGDREELFSKISDFYEKNKFTIKDLSTDLILIQFWLLAISLLYIIAYLVSFLLQ